MVGAHGDGSGVRRSRRSGVVGERLVDEHVEALGLHGGDRGEVPPPAAQGVADERDHRADERRRQPASTPGSPAATCRRGRTRCRTAARTAARAAGPEPAPRGRPSRRRRGRSPARRYRRSRPTMVTCSTGNPRRPAGRRWPRRRRSGRWWRSSGGPCDRRCRVHSVYLLVWVPAVRTCWSATSAPSFSVCSLASIGWLPLDEGPAPCAAWPAPPPGSSASGHRGRTTPRPSRRRGRRRGRAGG